MAFKPRTVQAVLWAAIVVAAGSLVLLRFRRQAPIERVAGRDVGFANRYVVRTSGAGDEILVDYQPPDGGKRPTVAQAPVPHGFRMKVAGIWGPFLKVGSKGSILISLTNQPLPSPGPAHGAAPPAAPQVIHASGANPRTTTYTETPSKYVDKLLRLDLASQTLEPLVEHALSSGFAVVGNEAYWIDPHAEKVEQIRDEDGSHTRFVRKPASLLKVTDLISRSTRTICSGMDMSDGLQISGSLVYWQRLEAYSNNGELKMTLWAYAPGSAGPVEISDHISSPLLAGINAPVLAGGRIIWLDFTPDAPRSPANPLPVQMRTRNGRMDVMSIQPDGAGKRTELSLHIVDGLSSLGDLQEDAGHAYCTQTARPRWPGADMQQDVCLLQPGSPQPLRRLFRLPGGSSFTGIHDGYAYYNTSETDMEGRVRPAYYRSKLR